MARQLRSPSPPTCPAQTSETAAMTAFPWSFGLAWWGGFVALVLDYTGAL